MAAQKILVCCICKRRFRTRRVRKTCSEECFLANQKRFQELRCRQYEAQQAKRKTPVRLDHEPVYDHQEIQARAREVFAKQNAHYWRVTDERRSKCEVCGRRVRLFSSVAGSVWLRLHRDRDGEVCSGSRSVVKYREGVEVLCDD